MFRHVILCSFGALSYLYFIIMLEAITMMFSFKTDGHAISHACTVMLTYIRSVHKAGLQVNTFMTAKYISTGNYIYMYKLHRVVNFDMYFVCWFNSITCVVCIIHIDCWLNIVIIRFIKNIFKMFIYSVVHCFQNNTHI